MALHVDAAGNLKSGSTILSKVLRGSEFIRNYKEYSDSAPGRDGEILFGIDVEAGLITLPCYVRCTPDTWNTKEYIIMAAINPKMGIQQLTFEDKPGKVFDVLFNGQLTFPEEGPNHRKFTLTFKVYSGYSIASTQSSKTGSGTVVNGGNMETPCLVEIVGPVTNPSVTIGSKIMTYIGQVTASDKVIIDTDKMTCTFNGANALANFNGVFPRLAIGSNSVTAASGGITTIKWHNRWI